MSPVFLLLMASVAYARFIFPDENNDQLQPFVTPSQSRRICTELCMSGLGGQPCGDDCMDIMPQGMPLHMVSETENARNQTRRDACAVLCPNQLGYPLCECDPSIQNMNPNFRVDFVQICSYYCLKHNYHVYGCQPCNVYERAQSKYTKGDMFGLQRSTFKKNGVDWEEWCKQQCLVGNGGAACNCDILPLSLTIA